MGNPKRLMFNEVIARLDEALSKNYFLEASWITYSLFEDRCNSILKKTGGLPLVQKGQFLSINKKLKTLKTRSASHSYLLKVPNIIPIVQDITSWKNKRNLIMHNMVDLQTSWENINNDAEKLARDGRKLLGKFASAAMKVAKLDK